MRLSELWVYPVKSLRGIPLERAKVGPRGLLWDRHWMLVDGGGRFLTQRELPRMALVATELTDDELRLQAPGMPGLSLPLQDEGEPELPVQVWGDRPMAASAGAEADAWLSAFLQHEARLVYLPRDSRRAVDPDYARADDEVGFADGFPFLLISQASLDDLNGRLAEPVPMRRFRPNLVVTGTSAYAEDGWSRIRVGELGFRVVKPCSRCKITTVDPDSAAVGTEPLKTLAGYRREGNKVYFGQNLLHDGEGELAVGMEVELLEAYA